MSTLRSLSYFVMAALMLFSCSRADDGYSVSQAGQGESAPDFTLLNLQKEPVTLSSFREEKPVLLFFWATWCPFCRRQIPELAHLRNQYSPEELEILAIDIQETSDQVAPYAAQMGMNYTVLLDETAAVSGAYGIVGVPTLVLVDKEGKKIRTDHALTPELLSAIRRGIT